MVDQSLFCIYEVLFILAQFRLILTGRYDSVTRDRAITESRD